MLQRRRKRKQTHSHLGWLILFIAACLLTVSGLYFLFDTKEKPATENPSTTRTQTSEKQASSKKPAASSSLPDIETSSSSDVPQELVGTAGLDDHELTAYADKVAYGVYYFNTDSYYSNNQSEPFIAASVIKVFIMDYYYENQIPMTTLIQGESLENLITNMIQYSDNTAANQLIDYTGMTVFNQYFQQAGYTQTVLERKMLDEAAQAQGLENKTSVPDTIKFLKKLYTKKEETPYAAMLTIMKGQQIATKIRSQLPPEVIVANKTGELATVENDIGLILDDQNPFAISILTNEVTSPGAERQAIGAFTLAAWQKNH